ncbi:MAG: SpoIIE family protein phosphatase [Cytophagales bacterium]|nr:SpoIIE family protein phosphatase [Cytophagales bacterium]MDW8384249.1 SpoIIE family protein phosphatase [Flammeovirgaceae bacterium]
MSRIFLLISIYLSSFVLWGQSNNIIPQAYDTFQLQRGRSSELYQALSDAIQQLKKVEKSGAASELIKAYANVAHVYRQMGLLKEAIEYTQKALLIARKHNPLEQATLLSQMVLLHLANQNLPGALQYAEEEKELYEKQHEPHGLAVSLCVLGDIYIKLKKYHEASVALHQAHRLAVKEKNPDLEWNAVINLSELYVQLEDAEQAEIWLHRAFELLKKNSHAEWVEYYLLLSKTYLIQKKIDKAIEAASFSLDRATSSRSVALIAESVLQLATLYEVAQQHQSSLQYYKTYTQLIKLLQSNSFYHNIEQLEIKFEVETKDQQIQMLTKEADFARYQTIIGSIAFVIVSILLFISYNAYRDKRDSEARLLKANQDIQAQNQEILRQNVTIAHRNKLIAQTVQYAKRVQQYVYAGQPNYFKVFKNVYVKDIPLETVSGDFYWTTYRADSFVLVFADCPEHDVAGAFNTIVMSALAAQVIQEYNYRNPAEILEEIDARMKKLQNPNENFSLSFGVRMAVCTINVNNKRMVFAGARIPLYYIHQNQVYYIEPDKRTLGKRYLKQKPKFQNHIFTLSPHDKIWFISDGFTNQIGAFSQTCMRRKILHQFMQENAALPLFTQGEHLVAYFYSWKEQQKQTDDVLLFGLEI